MRRLTIQFFTVLQFLPFLFIEVALEVEGGAVGKIACFELRSFRPNSESFRPNSESFRPNLKSFRPNSNSFRTNLKLFRPNQNKTSTVETLFTPKAVGGLLSSADYLSADSV